MPSLKQLTFRSINFRDSPVSDPTTGSPSSYDNTNYGWIPYNSYGQGPLSFIQIFLCTTALWDLRLINKNKKIFWVVSAALALNVVSAFVGLGYDDCVGEQSMNACRSMLGGFNTTEFVCFALTYLLLSYRKRCILPPSLSRPPLVDIIILVICILCSFFGLIIAGSEQSSSPSPSSLTDDSALFAQDKYQTLGYAFSVIYFDVGVIVQVAFAADPKLAQLKNVVASICVRTVGLGMLYLVANASAFFVGPDYYATMISKLCFSLLPVFAIESILNPRFQLVIHNNNLDINDDIVNKTNPKLQASSSTSTIVASSIPPKFREDQMRAIAMRTMGSAGSFPSQDSVSNVESKTARPFRRAFTGL